MPLCGCGPAGCWVGGDCSLTYRCRSVRRSGMRHPPHPTLPDPYPKLVCMSHAPHNPHPTLPDPYPNAVCMIHAPQNPHPMPRSHPFPHTRSHAPCCTRA
eukprot:265948-Chlamydomonas_euryale.AAC.1